MNGQLSLFATIEPAPAPKPAAPVVTWSGVTRAGVHAEGVLKDVGEVERFVRLRFQGRWRSLEVSVAGQVVGAIVPDGDRPQRRSWWVEGAS